MCPISWTRAGSRVAPRPMLCGKTVAPYMLPSPCTASMPYSNGMCSRVANAAFWKRSTMSAQAVGVFSVGVDPPPDRMLPRFQVVIRVASTFTLPRSVCVIWPTFSAKVIRASRSATGLAATTYRRRKISVIAAVAAIGLSVILPGSAHALSFTPQITQTVGTGSSESFLTLDFQDGTTDHNSAFGYFYDGAKTGADMLAALTAGTSLNIGYYPGYGPGDSSGVLVNSFSLNGHTKTGTNTDYWSYWLGSDGQTWNYSGVGASGRSLTNGSWDGWSWDANNANLAPLTPAAVPESSTVCLFATGLLGLACTAIRRRAARV